MIIEDTLERRHVKLLQRKNIIYPALIWLVIIIGYIILFNIGQQKYYNLTDTLIQWDGKHYLSIARDGYDAYPCKNNSSICGNVGWFPMYALASKPVGYILQNYSIGLIACSWICFLASLLLLFGMIERKYDQKTALWSLIALAVFPSSFYFISAFPYSVYLLLAVSIFYLLEKEKFITVIFLTGLLAVTYPSGSIIGFVLLYTLIKNWSRYNSVQKGQLFSSMAAIGIAIGLYFAFYWIKFDNFTMYLDFQSQPQFAHRMRFPLMTIIESFRFIDISHPVNISLIFTTIIVLIFYNKKTPINWQIYMFAILLFTPTMGTIACYYRHIIVAFPLFIMIGRAYSGIYGKYLMGLYIVSALIINWIFYIEFFKKGLLM